MSKKNIGKIGEAKFTSTISKIAQVEDTVDFRKPSFTNAPDGGMDFEIKAPHNISEKLKDIIDGKEQVSKLSDIDVKIRVDHKEYKDRKIGKAIAKKFVDDIEKNLDNAEHWLTGGKGLTAGAKSEIENAEGVVRHYSSEDIKKIDNYYQNELENQNINKNDE
jgi:predicted nucleotidyltransferase component of viral defense system